MNKRQAKRLWNVAIATKETKFPKKFTMVKFTHSCGTPACAIGNYAARTDLQHFLKIVQCGPNYYEVQYVNGPVDDMFIRDSAFQEYFGLTQDECAELFGFTGCNHANTPKAAVKYITHFLKKKGFNPAVDFT